jgi:Phage P22-like portal protein
MDGSMKDAIKIEIGEVIKAYDLAYEADRANKALANEAKAFAAGDGQWPEDVRRMREADGNLCLTVNMCPSFIAQVANDIRMSAPAVKVVATGGIAEEEPNKEMQEHQARKAADMRQGLIRHIENRSVAQKVAYSRAAGDLVTCGYGGWRVKTEYAAETSLLQEIRVSPLPDAVSIVWDEAAMEPTREDARFCFVPVDITREDFKEKYPDASPDEIGDDMPEYALGIWHEWVKPDTIRIAEYWFKKLIKAKFVSPDGARLIPADDEDAAPLIGAGAEVIERETTCVYRAVVSMTAVLEEPKKWLGRYIPIVPLFGPEIQIGATRRRFGLIEHAKDAQRRLNFFASAHAQAAAMQPKMPFIGTEKHFEGFEDIWSKANTANLPFITYNYDPQAPAGPQRVQPAVTSQGYAEGIELALGDMKRIIGIYDAALGQKSNETSGKAILARQRESDVGSYEFTLNFTLGIHYTGKILLDLMPRIYDTQRTFRVMGEDGKIDAITVNKAAGVVDEMNAEAAMLINDISAGEYDVVIEQGPSYTTKRDEAREAMIAFAQSDQGFMMAARDVVAKAAGMDDAVVKRLRATIPPQVLAAEKTEEGVPGQQQQQAPPPEIIAQQVEQEVMQRPEFAMKEAQAQKAAIDVQKANVDLQKAEFEFMVAQQTAMQPSQEPQKPMEPQGPDPIQAIQLKAIEANALKEIEFEFERRRKMMDQDHEMGGDGTESEGGKMRPLETLAQAIVQQGEAIGRGMEMLGDGMQQLAKAQMAPTRLIRDDKGRAAGAEKVMN